MANLFQPSLTRVTDSGGTPQSGAKLYLYVTNSSSNATWYTDAAGTTPGTNPLVADAYGMFDPVFLDPAITYRVVCVSSDNLTTIWDIDPVKGFDESEIRTVAESATDSEAGALAAKNLAEIARDEAEDFAADAAEEATNAQTAALAANYYPGARSYVPQGATTGAATVSAGGSGGTNGTFALAFSGGNFSVNPTGTFTVAGGAVTAISITGPGLYIGGAISAPTLSFAASTGLTGASGTYATKYLKAAGEYYVTDHATDADQAALFQNQANAAVEVDASLDWLNIAAGRQYAADAAASAAVAEEPVTTYIHATALQESIYNTLAARAGGLTSLTRATDLANYTAPATGQRKEYCVFQYDSENSFYWGDGQSWTDETAFLTGMGGASSGGVITFGPYTPADAPNLILNSSFSSTADWTGSTGVALSTTTDGGFPALVATCTSATTAKAYTRLNLAAGDTYRAVSFTAKVRRGTTTGSIKSSAGNLTTLNTVNGTNNSTTSYISSTITTIGHEGDSNGGNLYVGALSTGTHSGTWLISSDGLEAKEVFPFANYPQGINYQVIKFRTDAAGSGEVVLASAGDDSRGWFKLVYNRTTTALSLRIRGGNVNWGDISLGNVAANTEGRVAFKLKPDDTKVSLNGSQPETFAAGANVSIGGATKLRILGDEAGATSSGAILDWQIFAGECDDGWLTYASGIDLDPVAAFGDSFIQRVDDDEGISFAERLATALGRPVAIFAEGGTVPRRQFFRFMDAPGTWDGTVIWWDGGLSGIGDPLLSAMTYRRVRDTLGHDRFLLLPGVPPGPNTPGSPSAADETLRLRAVSLTEIIEDEYSGNWSDNSQDRYVDPAPILEGLSTGSADDLANIADGYPPDSVYEADRVHLNAAAADACAAECATQIGLIES